MFKGDKMNILCLFCTTARLEFLKYIYVLLTHYTDIDGDFIAMQRFHFCAECVSNDEKK